MDLTAAMLGPNSFALSMTSGGSGLTGQSIGPYRVLLKLGSGGMGDVYLAEDVRLGRRVALKSPSDTWLASPDARARLHREARAAAQLNHPNIAAIYDVLDLDERPHIVMEYVEGETLSARVRRGRLPVPLAVDIGLQLAEALASAHEHGVIHRDLKPGNVVITPDGRVKILDFGLAKFRAAPRPDDLAAGPPSLTTAGQLLGTPGYTSPEQLVGKPADPRSDIYSAGALLFELLTGRAPFEGDDAMALALATITSEPPAVRAFNPAVPEALEAIVRRAMAREARDRFQSALHLRAELTRVAASLSEQPTRTGLPDLAAGRRQSASTVTRRRAMVALLCVVLLAAVGIPLARRWTERPGASLSGGTPVVAVLPLENISG
ncbi:MAG: serine/threonine protein kinase, partial [Acidobacteria bacterium]|nr:serine/threonine protein kinase [Acidobacteriota bacterium]